MIYLRTINCSECILCYIIRLNTFGLVLRYTLCYMFIYKVPFLKSKIKNTTFSQVAQVFNVLGMLKIPYFRKGMKGFPIENAK